MRRTAVWTATAGALLAIVTGGAAAQEKTMTSPPRDLNTHHLFSPPASRTAWEERARDLRRQILFSAGLWPMPAKTPLRPQITGRVEGPDYVIENVAIQTWPGFYLCGNLYKPKNKKGPFPAIVNPHGHWQNGRLQREADVPRAAPPPAPPADGRADLVALGVNLARQGFVVFAYDMAGYNDTNQVNHQFANGLEPWLWNVSLLGLQLWSGIRAVDYVQNLPDVDKGRIGATGASGGGTQTFLLSAIDERVKVAVPVNMISAHMQGGCLCENAPGLRVGTDNAEIGALMAPRPLLLVAATGDWTRNNPREEWPAIKKVYDLYGAGERTDVRQFNYQHNYNIESREAMYAWFGKWLHGRSEPQNVAEKPFEVDVAALRVWNERHPRPADALGEPALIQALQQASEKQFAARLPKNETTLARFRQTMQPALQQSLSVRVPAAVKKPGGAGPTKAEKVALVVTLDAERDAPRQTELRAALTVRGYRVVLLPLTPLEATPDTLWKSFFTTYNRTPLGDRVQQIVDVLASLNESAARVDVVGVGEAGLWALLARGVSPPAGGRTVVDTAGFDSANDRAYVDRFYAPGLRRAGDVRTAALLLAATGGLCLHNAGEQGAAVFHTKGVADAFRALKAASLRIERQALSGEEIAAWLSSRR